MENDETGKWKISSRNCFVQFVLISTMKRLNSVVKTRVIVELAGCFDGTIEGESASFCPIIVHLRRGRCNGVVSIDRCVFRSAGIVIRSL